MLRAAANGYPPFQRFKSRLAAGLPLDFSRLSTPCRAGLVSVVLPVFNGEKFVAEAVASVLGQTYSALELIVVDDGSTDRTPSILDRFRGDRRLRVLRQDNRKLPAALNAGFACARGEYYTWISADNRLSPAMISTLVECLEANAAVQMVYADEELIDEAGQPLRNRRFYWDYQTPRGSGVIHLPHDTGELNYNHNNYIGACFLYRAWTAKILGPYDPACFGFEDYDYWLRMNALFRVAHRGVAGPLYQYRLHPASLTSRAAELRILHRSRDRVALDKKRRQFFLEPFDITFAGHHPYFAPLARAYRDRGHNVHSAKAGDAYLYEVTRAFRKAILITAGPIGPAPFATGQHIFHAIAEEDRIRLPAASLSAPSADALAYPLLAAANAALWSAAEKP